MFGMGMGRMGVLPKVGAAAFSPLSLFSSGEQGAWYDPSDLTTMFQDGAGTTPVTADGQPVGLILDKSKGLVLGPELVTNGTFNTDTGWGKQPGWTISGGAATFTPGTTGFIYQNISGLANKWLEITLTVTQGELSFLDSQFYGQVVVLTGTTTLKIRSRFDALNLWSNTLTTFDNISIKELAGNHGKQSTAAARPAIRYSPYRIDYDAVDDTIVSTFASSLGTDCTVCRAVQGIGASILTAQTIGTSYTDSTDHCGLIVIDRALTAGETSDVTAYLNAKAGV